MVDHVRRNGLLRLAVISATGLARNSFAFSMRIDDMSPHSAVFNRRLRSTIHFENPFGRSLANQHFWCYLPMCAGTQQNLRKVDVSMPHRVLEDEIGHRILALEFSDFPAYGKKIVSMTAQVDVDPAIQTQVLASPSSWLKAERFIESDDERIRSAAQSLRRGSPVETLRAIFEWTKSHIAYAGYLPDDRGALYALTQARGDCTEYADLVVALARANSMPARMVGGYVTDRDAAPKAQDYHNWAEVFFEGAWRIVDAQKGNWFPLSSQYVAYRVYRDIAINPVGLAHRYRLDGELLISF